MHPKISDILNVSEEDLKEKGVFNSFVSIDSSLHVDPSLLGIIDIPEFSNSYKTFKDYFKKIITLIKYSDRDIKFRRKAIKLLTFPENDSIHLGYSGGKPGNGIGPKIAKEMFNTAKVLIEAGNDDPLIFEVIGVFEENIGADRISDMVINIIIEDLMKFTERVSLELGLSTNLYKGFNLPKNSANNKPIIFVAEKILRDLPVAFDWSSIDTVCQYNKKIREKVNKIIGSNWKSATNKNRVSKADLKDVILKYPDLLNDLINKYTKKEKVPYDFKNDPAGEFVWHDITKNIGEEVPIENLNNDLKDVNDLRDIVNKILVQFKRLIEFNGWWEHLYENNGKGKLRNERFVQKLFYGTALSYCEANDLDLCRENNLGSGPIDFKISKGFKYKINIEIKYSGSSHSKKGYIKQLPIYNEAENIQESIYLVIQMSDNKDGIENLFKLKTNNELNNVVMPDIFVIDGRKKESASK